MKPSDAILLHRARIVGLVEAHRVRNPRLFGSTASRTDHEGSDLDLLVDPLPETTLLDLGGLQMELEELLGISVDVMTPGDLPVRFRARVLAEALPI